MLRTLAKAGAVSALGLGLGLLGSWVDHKPQEQQQEQEQEQQQVQPQLQEQGVAAAQHLPRPEAAPQLLGGPQKDELRLVQVVFRHGARTPLASRYWQSLVEQWDICSGDSYRPCPLLVVTEAGRPRPWNEDDTKQVNTRYPGGCSKGELTVEGRCQAQDFGAWLRWRYMMVTPFLPDTSAPEPGTLEARTTNYSRTIATLQGVLTGLYPTSRDPVTAITTDELDEIMYANVKACARLKELIFDLSKAHKASNNKLAGDVQQAAAVARQVLGLGESEAVNFVDLHDALTCATAHGKPLPTALQDPHLQRVVEQQATRRFLAVLAPHAETGKQQDVLRLSMGRLMQMMIQHMEEAAQGSQGPRLHLYSGHDSSILPLLVALGKEVTSWPPYLSHLVFELWRRPASGEHYVKVLYNRMPLQLSELCPEGEGGGASCGLQQFREHVLGPYLLTQEAHRDECMLSFHHDRPVGDPQSVEEHQLRHTAAGGAGGEEGKVSIGAALEED